MNIPSALSSIKKYYGLSLVCGAGLFLRLYHLDKVALWHDELITGGRAKIPLAALFKEIDLMPFPPLYYTMMNLWCKVFGIGAVSLRIPSVVFSVLSILFIYKLAKELYDDQVALFSAILLCVSPYAINYAQDAKMYSMLWFWGILSFLSLWKFIKSNSRVDLFAYVAATTLAIYTTYPGLMFIPIHNAIFFSARKTNETRAWLSGQLLLLLFFLPWIYWLYFHLTHVQQYLGWVPDIQSYSVSLIKMFRAVIGNKIGDSNEAEVFLYALLVVSAFVSFDKKTPSGKIFDFKKEESALLLWILLSVFVYSLIDVFFFKIFFIHRHIAFILFPIIILLGKGINAFNNSVGRIKLKYIILFVLLFSTFANHLSPYYERGFKINTDHVEECFAWLNKNAPKDSLILNFNVPFLVLRYFGLEEKVMLSSCLAQEKANKYESVVLLYWYNKDKRKERLTNNIAKKLHLYVSDEYNSTDYDMQAVLLKKKGGNTGHR